MNINILNLNLITFLASHRLNHHMPIHQPFIVLELFLLFKIQVHLLFNYLTPSI